MKILIMGHSTDFQAIVDKIEASQLQDCDVTLTNSIGIIDNINDFDVILLNDNDIDSFLQERRKSIFEALNYHDEPLGMGMTFQPIHKKRKNKKWESTNKYHR